MACKTGGWLKTETELDRVDCIVVGAGVIGLAIAREMAMTGRDVLVVERNHDFGLETSSRNSEVIHAGLYYPPGSLKAAFCLKGRRLLLDYLKSHHIEHRLLGKLIVASRPSETDRLEAIDAKARANGVDDLQPLDARQVMALEPAVKAVAGLYSPGTGILDSRAFMRALLGDLEGKGGALALNTQVEAIRRSKSGFILETRSFTGERHRIATACLVNASGLYASAVAASMAPEMDWAVPQIRFARGTYYGVDGKVPFRHLVYPVPEPGGLGIHLTLDLSGAIRFGPDVEWVEEIDYRLEGPDLQRIRTAISSYWPGIADRSLSAIACGIRPKLAGPGEADHDFLIAGPATHGLDGLVHLLGIESPGLTSALAIAEHVADALA